MREKQIQQENKKRPTWRNRIIKKLIVPVIAIIIVLGIGISMGKEFFADSKSTKLGFEDIGELATQVAYCTEVSVVEGARDLFGVTIPFTESKYIYSYDVIIKAGLDFTKIEWAEENNTIEVELPEIRILSSEIDLDSFKVYHEDESIFRQISMTENNESFKTMQQEAEQDAVANGLLDNARSNAESILREFFANKYDLEQYTIHFIS